MKNIQTDLFGCARKKTINSKAKGNKNEQQACKTVGIWTGHPFRRVPSSGALRWDDAAKIAGDIVCDVKGYNFPFSIETKALKTLHAPIRLGKRSVFYTIMKQCYFDAVRSDRLPMMLLRSSGMDTFKFERKSYQNYYLVLLWQYGGRELYSMLKAVGKASGAVAFVGKDTETGFSLIGFNFREVFNVPGSYKALEDQVTSNDLITKFKADKQYNI
jgi:hypothetical protein